MAGAAFQKGEVLYAAGRYADALQAFKENLKESPNNAATMTFAALCEFSLGHHNESLRLLMKALAIRPLTSDIHYYIAQTVHITGDPQKAKSYIESAIRLQPANSVYYAELSAIYLAMLQPEEAIKAANDGLKVNPQDTLCLNARAQGYIFHDMPRRGLEDAMNSLKIDPKNHMTYEIIALQKYRTEDYEEAQTYYRKALELNPESEAAINMYSEAFRMEYFIYRFLKRYRNQQNSERFYMYYAIFLAWVVFSMVYRDGVGSKSSPLYVKLAAVTAGLLFLGAMVRSISDFLISFKEAARHFVSISDQVAAKYAAGFGVIITAGILMLFIFPEVDLFQYLIMGAGSLGLFFTHGIANAGEDRKRRYFLQCYGWVLTFLVAGAILLVYQGKSLFNVYSVLFGAGWGIYSLLLRREVTNDKLQSTK